MREIKFRAWKIKDTWSDERTNKMYYGVERAYDTMGMMLDSNGKEIEYSWSSFAEILDENDEGNLVLMQYIGLKDKNGKEIYEGDIVKDDGGDIAPVEYMQTKEPKFTADGEHGGILSFTETDVEVVGNIYENPELLPDSK